MTTDRAKNALSPDDYEALANLRYRLRRFTEFSTGQVQKFGITAEQHQALLAIKGLAATREMTIGMLADRLLIAPYSATAVVNTLAAAGYVARVPSRADRRRQIIGLTDKAEDVLDQLSGVHLHEIREMAPELMQALRILQDRRKLEQIAWMA